MGRELSEGHREAEQAETVKWLPGRVMDISRIIGSAEPQMLQFEG